jgi:hypothetical protein
MAEAVGFTVIIAWRGKVVVGPGSLSTSREAGQCVARVLKGLGLPEKRWAKLGPQVRVMHGFEAGGWCALVVRGEAQPRLTSAALEAQTQALASASPH